MQAGIGNATLLEAHGILSLVDLPGVGENFQVTLSLFNDLHWLISLQEHLFVAVQYLLKPGYTTFGKPLLVNDTTIIT